MNDAIGKKLDRNQAEVSTGVPGSRLRIFFLAWIILALILLIPITILLRGSFPIFTVIWLVVPLFVLLRSKKPGQVGLRVVSRKDFIQTTAINLVALLLVMAVFEPWSHTYQMLLNQVRAASSPDTTFAWIFRFSGLAGWVGMTAYSGLVTLFAEELFFRGWLFQLLQKRMKPIFAIGLQAALFTIPQAIIAFFLPPLQGALYIVVYSWFSIGIIGGWAAMRTQSIWPGLFSATICNLLLTAVTLGGK